MSDLEIATFQYMNDFQCIGPDCEAHCCAGWSVTFDKKYHDRLKRVMGTSRKSRDLFKIAVKRTASGTSTADKYGHFQHDEHDNCRMLDSQSWCEIHKSFGEASLSNVCSMYPRRLIRVAEALELTGIPSCPEIARLLLLTDDPLNVVAPDAGKLPRLEPHAHLPSSDPRLAIRHYEDVRSFLLHLLCLGEWSLEKRLFFMAYFAKRVTGFMDLESLEDKLPLLASAVETMSRSSMLEQLSANYDELEVPEAPALALAGMVLRTAESNERAKHFRKLAAEVREGLGGRDLSDENAEAILQKYRHNRQALVDAAGTRMEHYATRYCANYLFSVPWVASPNLLVYMQRMLLSVAVQRFLLCNLPGVQESLGKDEPELVPVLDDAAVNVLYAIARAVEHSTMLTRLEDHLDALNPEVFANVVFLLRF